MSRFNPDRRRLLHALGASAALAGAAGIPGSSFAAAAGKPGKKLGRVVVIGAGFGGATAAKYLRKWSNGAIEVTLIERNKQFISCPASNEVLGGNRAYDSLVHSYDGLRKNWGIRLVHASVTGIDADRRRVRTDSARDFEYDRLVLSPGFDFIYGGIEGYDAKAQETILHAWKAGPQTLALRKQLEDLPDGGTYVLSVPKAPYRCPPGPYERASQIAWYFKTHKPRSKVIVLDANDKVISKEKLFLGVWESEYKGILEYRPGWNVVAVDAVTNIVTSELGDKERGEVLNLLPPQRAADIARVAGVVNVNDRWADVDWISLESTAVKNIHILGDALQAAPLMPKSGHMANQHGKAAAAAIVEILSGREPQPTLMANTCYSLVDDKRGHPRGFGAPLQPGKEGTTSGGGFWRRFKGGIGRGRSIHAGLGDKHMEGQPVLIEKPMETILIVPGLRNSGPTHWQTWFENTLTDTQRVDQADWNRPSLSEWAARVREAIHAESEPVWIVAHSFGCLAAVSAGFTCASRVRAALLVAPADPDRFEDTAVLPEERLGFPSLVVASNNDPWVRSSVARYWSDVWGSGYRNIGDAGHINVDSGYGQWPEGLGFFQELRQEVLAIKV